MLRQRRRPLERAGKALVFVVNAATPRAKITYEAAIALSQHGTVAPVTIHHRTDFASSMIDGRTVMEIDPNGRSAGEIQELWRYLSDRLEKNFRRTVFQPRQGVPAVPGIAPPIKALCVAPFGMEEGTEADMPGLEFGLVTGEEAEFRFLGSTVRRDDRAGAVVDEWEGQVDELAPIRTTLEAKGAAARQVVPVHLHSKVTEVGQLEVWCHSRDGKQRWKLEFNVREGR